MRKCPPLHHAEAHADCEDVEAAQAALRADGQPEPAQRGDAPLVACGRHWQASPIAEGAARHAG
eukprot:8577771-Pyramimonas_sp.AAC.1